MTKEEKQARKHRRCEKRREKKKEDYNAIGYYMRKGLSVGQAKSVIHRGYFYNDYGEIKRVCNYMGFCDYPCNGDC